MHSVKSVLNKLCSHTCKDCKQPVAKPGVAGGLEPPHWLVKYAKSHVFCAFEADFL